MLEWVNKLIGYNCLRLFSNTNFWLLANSGGNSSLIFLAANIFVPKTPVPLYEAPPVASAIAAFIVESTPADAIVFYTIAWVSWQSSASDCFCCCIEDANNADSYSTNYANPVLVAAAGGYFSPYWWSGSFL